MRNASYEVIWEEEQSLGSVLCSELAADFSSFPATLPALPHLSQQLLPSLGPVGDGLPCPGWQSPPAHPNPSVSLLGGPHWPQSSRSSWMEICPWEWSPSAGFTPLQLLLLFRSTFVLQREGTPVWGAKVCPHFGLILTLLPLLPRNNNIPFFFPAVLWIPPAVLAHTTVILVPFVLCMTKQWRSCA